MGVESIADFVLLGPYLNYPLQLDAPGRESACPETKSDAITILAQWFEEGPTMVTVLDHEEDDPIPGEDDDE